MPPTPDLRIGIVSWNTADLLDRCLASLPAATEGVEAEVVVVDNASADDSADVADRHEGVTVVRSPTNEGYARGMNRALAGSDAPFLLALNPDTEAPPGSLSALVGYACAHPRAGLVVPRLLESDGSVQHSVLRFPSVRLAAASGLVPARLRTERFGRRWWLVGGHPHDVSGPIEWAIGAVHLIRRASLAGSDPYSERWFMYVEDLELCWRLHRDGWEVHLCADVDVPHVGNASGELQWGDRRARRYWAATYDFLTSERGALNSRAYATVNSVAVGLHWLAALARGDRGWAGALRTELPVHVRAAVQGAPPLEGPPSRR